MTVADPILNAAELLAHRRRQGLAPAGPAPETVLLTYQRSLLTRLKRRHRCRPLPGFYGEVVAIQATGGRLAVAGGFGVGAAVTAVLAEDLIAYGVRQLVIVGLAAGLQPEMRPGEVVVASHTVLDTAIARLYLPQSRYHQPDHGLQGRLRQALDAGAVPYRTGSTWTVDVPYQVSRIDATEQQAWGTAVLELEAGALMAVGQALGVSAGAVLVVADTLADGRWRLEANQRRAERSLLRVAEALIEAL